MFFEVFSKDQEYYYEEDLKQLSLVRKPEHMNGNQLLENFKWELSCGSPPATHTQWNTFIQNHV